MKRSREPSPPSKFSLAIANACSDCNALHKHMGLSRHQILEMPHEELVRELVRQKPAAFVTLLKENAHIRNVLAKIPFFYFYLFKYSQSNEYVVTQEMSSSYLKQWPIFYDLHLRSRANKKSVAPFAELCAFFTLNPDRPSSFNADLVLTPKRALHHLQYYDDANDQYASFFRYQHRYILAKCRVDRTFAQEMALLYSLLYPFGCPNASYYTVAHHEVREAAFYLVKLLSVSSIGELKMAYPKDPQTHNPLLCIDSMLTIFLHEVRAVVALNRQILSTAVNNLVVTNDKSYEEIMLSLLNVVRRFESLCIRIDAGWLCTFVEKKLKPILVMHHNAIYSSRNHLTADNVNARLLSLYQLAERRPTHHILYYETLDGQACDEALLKQLQLPQKAQQRSIEDLMSSLLLFIKDAEPGEPSTLLASDLYAELALKAESPLVYCQERPNMPKAEKLQEMYRLLFYHSVQAAK